MARLLLFIEFVPKIQSSQFKVFGMEVSYKSWIYLLSAQLMFNAGLPSVVSSLSALLAGMLYAGDHFGCQKWRLPRWLELPFRLIGRILSFLTPSFPTNAMQGGNRQQGRLFGRAEGGDNDDDDRRILNMPASSSNYAASQLRNRGRGQGGLLDEPLPPDENAIAALVVSGDVDLYLSRGLTPPLCLSRRIWDSDDPKSFRRFAQRAITSRLRLICSCGRMHPRSSCVI